MSKYKIQMSNNRVRNTITNTDTRFNVKAQMSKSKWRNLWESGKASFEQNGYWAIAPYKETPKEDEKIRAYVGNMGGIITLLQIAPQTASADFG